MLEGPLVVLNWLLQMLSLMQKLNCLLDNCWLTKYAWTKDGTASWSCCLGRNAGPDCITCLPVVKASQDYVEHQAFQIIRFWLWQCSFNPRYDGLNMTSL
jgi:hypothetical protein